MVFKQKRERELIEETNEIANTSETEQNEIMDNDEIIICGKIYSKSTTEVLIIIQMQYSYFL